jgi:acetylornithine aminotransferase/acetylornithine/N-succinyldiaminopimelate aminotransferase
MGGNIMELNEIKELDSKYYMNTFGNRVPVSFKYGKGINLWGTDDKKYYDFMSGIAVSA